MILELVIAHKKESPTLERADDVLARRAVVPGTYYDELLAALYEPPRVVPELLSAMQRQVVADVVATLGRAGERQHDVRAGR